MVQEFSVAYEFTRTTGYQYQKEKPRSDRHSEQIQTTHTRMVPCKHLKTKAISKFGKVAVHRGSSIGAQEKWLSIGASWKSGCPSELPGKVAVHRSFHWSYRSFHRSWCRWHPQTMGATRASMDTPFPKLSS